MGIGSGDCQIGSSEIPADEQQRSVARFGERIGKAIAVVQAGRMAAFAEPPKGGPGEFRLNRIDGYDLDAGPIDQQIDFSPPASPLLLSIACEGSTIKTEVSRTITAVNHPHRSRGFYRRFDRPNRARRRSARRSPEFPTYEDGMNFG